MRIVLAGAEAAGVQALRALDQRGADLVAVLAPEEQSVTGASLAAIARAIGSETWPAEWAKEASLADRLRERDVDVVLNVHSLYRVDAAALEAPRYGWYNLHPGLLPQYAGLNTSSWAICCGETEHGVTVHRMAPRIDAGPIAFQERFPIEPRDTGLSLSTKCARIGVELMVRLAEALEHDPDSVPRRGQDESALRYFRRDERPIEGELDWDQPAAVVDRTIRAYDFHPLAAPWGYPQAQLAGRVLGVSGASRTGRATDATPGDTEPSQSGAILVACADEWVRISRVSVDGRVLAAATLLEADSRMGT